MPIFHILTSEIKFILHAAYHHVVSYSFFFFFVLMVHEMMVYLLSTISYI